MKGQACGEDNIGYPMMKYLPIHAKKLLLFIFNEIWMYGTIPEAWKSGIVIPIPKHNERSTDPCNFRPITLLSCVGKAMEKMVNRRVIHVLEERKLLDSRQHGFRKGKSTEGYFIELEAAIHDYYEHSLASNCALLDISKAYDQTWRHNILTTLVEWGIAGRMMEFLISFLEDHTFKVLVGSHLSNKRIAENGVPQGAIVSVTLFLVTMNTIFNHIPKGVNIVLYADDILLMTSGKVRSASRRRLQKGIDNVIEWANNVGFTISREKSNILSIDRRKKFAGKKQTHIHVRESNPREEGCQIARHTYR